MIVFGNLIYHYLVYVDLNLFPFFGGNFDLFKNIFYCLVCVYYVILTYFLKKISMASQYDEEYYTSGSFPIYSIKSCHKSHSDFVLILNLCKFILYFVHKLRC